MDEWGREMIRFAKGINENVANYPANLRIRNKKQLLSHEDLEVGAIYKHVCDGDGEYEDEFYLCVSMPYRNRYGQWVIRMVRWPNRGYGQEIHLTDSGLIPYPNGKFNPSWYFEMTDQKVPKEEAVELSLKYVFH